MAARRHRASWPLLAVLLGCAAPAPADPMATAVAVGNAAVAPDPDAGEECTVGVACGRATHDGRPLLWKNRDAKVHDNVVTAFDDGKWPYVGITNAGAKTSVWGGANATGFCIMNSLSRDLTEGSKTGPGNGPFMKLALRTCATVEDFEALLQRTNETGRRTRANFGVIDAKGGAAFFETSHLAFRRYDAADTESGVLVRANFAFTGGGKGGRDRFERAEQLCRALPGRDQLTASWLLREFVRDLSPPRTAATGEPGELDARETIHRQTTVASMVFAGCLEHEDPRCTTMWAVLGQPLFSVAVPCWPAAERVCAAVAGAPKSPICDAAQAIQTVFYRRPEASDDGEEDEEAAQPERADDEAGPTAWLLTSGLSKVREQVLTKEAELVAASDAAWRDWRRRQHTPTPRELYDLHERLAEQARETVEAIAERFAGTSAKR